MGFVRCKSCRQTRREREREIVANAQYTHTHTLMSPSSKENDGRFIRDVKVDVKGLRCQKRSLWSLHANDVSMG